MATAVIGWGVLLLALSVTAIFVVPLLRTRDRDADSIGRIQTRNWRGLADVVRAVRGR